MSQDGNGLGKVVELLLDTGRQKIRTVEVKPNTGEDDGEYLLVGPDGQFQRVQPRPAPRNYGAGTLASFADLVGEFARRNGAGAEQAAGSPRPKVFVFVGPDAVVALLDESTRRERVTFELNKADSWGALCELAAGQPLQQKDLIDTLRRRLACPTEPADLVGRVRKLKFTTAASGSSSVQQGRESLGREVQRELVGAGELPDDVRVTLPVYSNVRHGGDLWVDVVTCTLDVNIEQQSFVLRPKAGELDRVQDAVLSFIAAELAARAHADGVGDVVQVLVGSPDIDE